MSFTGLVFIIFFCLVLSVLSLSQLAVFENKFGKVKVRLFRQGFLLVMSYVFYAWWDYRFCLLVALISFVAYICADFIYRKKCEMLFRAIGVAVPLIVLGIFKYFDFFLESIYTLFGIENGSVLNLLLPLGISFYTFQSMSYTIDVSRGKIKPESLFKVALYVSFFPVITSGPIVRAGDFLPQLNEDKRITLKGIETGAQIFLFGLFKKIVLADRLSVFVGDVYDAPNVYSSFTVILAVIAYSLQIYFDFSGYSDMAIGCGKCLGYDIKANFNLPYLSKNPTEFWKRWHISLSSWLQDYLYISLGGNRKGEIRTYINLILTMLLGGLWHGANWTFIVWGALNGVALCVHKVFRKCLKIPKTKQAKGVKAGVSVLMNFIFVSICWVFFRADSFGTAIAILKKIILFSDGLNQPYTWLFFALTAEILYVIYCFIKNNYSGSNVNINSSYILLKLDTVQGLLIFFLAIMVTIGLAYTGASPFIYQQF